MYNECAMKRNSSMIKKCQESWNGGNQSLDIM